MMPYSMQDCSCRGQVPSLAGKYRLSTSVESGVLGCAMQGVPHVPPAESSDDDEQQEPEPEEDIHVADLSEEQQQQQAQAAAAAYTAEGIANAQVKPSWEAPSETQEDLHSGVI